MRFILGTCCLLLASLVQAQLPAAGEALPTVAIDDGGSIEIEGDDLVFQPWSSDSLKGRPVYLQHMAARAGIDEINKSMDNAVEALGYSAEQLVSVAIANKDDATWGTGLFVAGQLKKNKLRYPDTVIVADNEGAALKQWQLQPENAAVILLSPEGQVLFFKEGALSAEEIDEAVAILVAQVEG
jgi:YtfJ family uncharacterized protein